MVLGMGMSMGVDAQEATPKPIKTVERLEQNKKDIADKEAEIKALEKKIQDLLEKREATGEQADVLQQEVQRLQYELEKMQLQVRQTHAGIANTLNQQEEAKKRLVSLDQEIAHQEQQLRIFIKLLYENSQQSLLHMMLSSNSFSEALAQQQAIQEIQNRIAQSLETLQKNYEEVKKEQGSLAEKELSLRHLYTALAEQQQTQETFKQRQEQLLQTKQHEASVLDHRIAEARIVRSEIEKHVFQLKGAGVEIKLNDAFDMARYAGTLTGVRPALIMAVLKVETNVGENLGSGVFPDDMQPESREAFLRVTKKLGVDPAKSPISARPRSYRGWGGAMGPGQFMPATWETIETRIAGLMKKTVANPYELSDAFVGTAIMLADRGGTNRGGEYEAVNRYLAGPNWQYVTWYGDKVLAVAEEYDKTSL